MTKLGVTFKLVLNDSRNSKMRGCCQVKISRVTKREVTFSYILSYSEKIENKDVLADLKASKAF